MLTLVSPALPNVKDLLMFGLAGSAGAVWASSDVGEDTGAKCRLKKKKVINLGRHNHSK